jgi:dihydrofolate reductase
VEEDEPVIAASGARRPRCSVFIAVSADGYIARPDGGLDWLAAVQMEGEDYGYKAFFDSIDTLIVGRKTHDTARSFDAWPYTGKRCVVLTHRPVEPLEGVESFEGSPTILVERLGREGAARIYVDGGAVIQQFLAAGLIDDLTISVVPVLLGAGVRLFAGAEPEHRMVLEQARSWPTGLVQIRYRVE